MKRLIIILIISGIACVSVRQNGLKVEKTSSKFGDFVRVESCSPTLTWDPSDPTIYGPELQKAIQAKEEKAKSQNTLQTNLTTPTVIKTTIAYDVAVYSVLKANMMVPLERGEKVFYVEDISTNSVQITPALNPNTKYFWSVRERLPDGRVSEWSTYNKFLSTPYGSESKYNYWFGLKTPSTC